MCQGVDAMFPVLDLLLVLLLIAGGVATSSAGHYGISALL